MEGFRWDKSRISKPKTTVYIKWSCSNLLLLVNSNSNSIAGGGGKHCINSCEIFSFFFFHVNPLFSFLVFNFVLICLFLYLYCMYVFVSELSNFECFLLKEVALFGEVYVCLYAVPCERRSGSVSVSQSVHLSFHRTWYVCFFRFYIVWFYFLCTVNRLIMVIIWNETVSFTQ